MMISIHEDEMNWIVEITRPAIRDDELCLEPRMHLTDWLLNIHSDDARTWSTCTQAVHTCAPVHAYIHEYWSLMAPKRRDNIH